MPLLMCPNDNTAMQTLERSGVQFDMCPSCRGVWLDRGELEKLIEGATAEGRASAPVAQQTYAAPPPPQQAQPSPWGGGYRDDRPRDDRPRDDRPRDDRYRHSDDHRYKKKKRDSIFDIFD